MMKNELTVEQVERLRHFAAEIAVVCHNRKLKIFAGNVFDLKGNLIASNLETFPGYGRLMAFDIGADGGLREIHGEHSGEVKSD